MLWNKNFPRIWRLLRSHQEALTRGLLALGILLFAVYFSLYQIQAHRALWTGVDLTNLEQTLWNTLHGNFMRSTYFPAAAERGGEVDFTTRKTESRLGTHVQPFFLVLMFPYALFPSAELLMVLLSLALGLGALPIFTLARRRLTSSWLALIAAWLYLLWPAVQTNAAWEVHGVSFLPPLLLAALDAAERGKQRWWWLWVLLAMGCREDIPFLVGWAMLWLAPREQRRTAIAMFGVGLLWSLLSFFIIIPHYGGGGSPFLSFFFPPGTPVDVTGIMQTLQDPQYWLKQAEHFLEYNLFLGLPLLFLYCLHLPSLLAMVPLLVLNGLGWHQAVRLPFFSHYSAPIVPWALVGAIEGARSLARWLHRRRPNFRARELIWTALLLTVILVNVMQGYLPFSLPAAWPRPLRALSVVTSVLNEVPDEAALSTSMHLAPHLARRSMLRVFPDLRDAEWLVLDVWNWADPYGPAVPVWREVLTDPTWEMVAAKDGVLVLRRGDGPPRDVGAAFVPQGADALRKLEVRFGNAWRLTGADIFPLPWGHFVLCTDWQSADEAPAMRPAVRLAADAESQTLRSYTLLPEIYATSGKFRDCTHLLAPAVGVDVTIGLVLYGVDDIIVVEAGEWEEQVWLEDAVLYLENPAW